MHLKYCQQKCRPFCVGLNQLIKQYPKYRSHYTINIHQQKITLCGYITFTYVLCTFSFWKKIQLYGVLRYPWYTETAVDTSQGLPWSDKLVWCKHLKNLWAEYHHSPYLPHDDIMSWEHLQYCWPFVRGIHRSLLDSSDTSPVMQSFKFLFLAWTRCGTNRNIKSCILGWKIPLPCHSN